jgi:hypothetical protein
MSTKIRILIYINNNKALMIQQKEKGKLLRVLKTRGESNGLKIINDLQMLRNY